LGVSQQILSGYLGAPNQGDKVTKSKKTLYTIIAIHLIAIVAVASYSYWKQLTTIDVVITDFKRYGPQIMVPQSLHSESPLLDWPFTVIVEDRGSNDVSGLTLYVKMFIGIEELGQDSEHLSTISGNQSLFLYMDVFLYQNVTLGKNMTCIATLQLDSKVINESDLPLEILQSV
jgi:hypothetical protein